MALMALGGGGLDVRRNGDVLEGVEGGGRVLFWFSLEYRQNWIFCCRIGLGLLSKGLTLSIIIECR